MLLFVLMLTSCISNIVSWFVLHVRGQYWPFAFILNKKINTLALRAEHQSAGMSEIKNVG